MNPDKNRDNSPRIEIRAIKIGACCGILACVVYPLMTQIPLPRTLGIVLASSFGPLLIMASMGLYQLLAIGRKTASLEAAKVFNIIAGAMVTAMLLVQSAVNAAVKNFVDGGATLDGVLKTSWRFVDNVQLGLDVSWDIFIAIGTVLFAINMMRHSRFGKIFGISGMLIALALISFNLAAFPTPPANAGLIDLGPLIGLWYLAVSIQTIRSFKWAESAISAE